MPTSYFLTTAEAVNSSDGTNLQGRSIAAEQEASHGTTHVGGKSDITVFGLVDTTLAVTSTGGTTIVVMAGGTIRFTPVVVDCKATVDKADGGYPAQVTVTPGNARTGDEMEIGGATSGTTANSLQSSHDATSGVLIPTGTGTGRQATCGADGSEATVSLFQPDGQRTVDIVAPGRTVDLHLCDVVFGHRRSGDTPVTTPGGETGPSTWCAVSRRARRTTTC